MMAVISKTLNLTLGVERPDRFAPWHKVGCSSGFEPLQ